MNWNSRPTYNTNKQVVEIDTEKISTTSIKSKVNPAKEMTLNVAIYKNAVETCSQQSMEQATSLHATTIKDLPSSSIINS